MEIENAKRLISTWAEMDPVRVYEPKKKSGKPEPEKKQKRKPWYQFSLHLNIDGKRFGKRYGILLVAAAVFTVYTILLSAGVEAKTEKRVTEEVTSQLRQDFQKYLDQQEQERKATQFLTGDASFEAAVEELAEPLSYILAAYRMEFGIPENGLRTIGWVYCARYAQNSTEFGRTPQEILEKVGAWEGTPVGHARSNHDIELSKEIATSFLKGEYPDSPYTTAMTFFVRDNKVDGKIAARNEYATGAYTEYWWYGKK